MTNQPEKRLTETELRICLKYPASELEHEWLACHIAALESDLARVTQERDELRSELPGIRKRLDAAEKFHTKIHEVTEHNMLLCAEVTTLKQERDEARAKLAKRNKRGTLAFTEKEIKRINRNIQRGKERG